MRKNNLYIIPKEDINEYLDYDDITIFPSIKSKRLIDSKKRENLHPINLIAEIKEQRLIINKMIAEKEELSTKFLKASSYINSLEHALSLEQKRNLDALMETLETMQSNFSFLETIVSKLK